MEVCGSFAAGMEGPILLLTQCIALSILALPPGPSIPKETGPRGWRS